MKRFVAFAWIFASLVGCSKRQIAPAPSANDSGGIFEDAIVDDSASAADSVVLGDGASPDGSSEDGTSGDGTVADGTVGDGASTDGASADGVVVTDSGSTEAAAPPLCPSAYSDGPATSVTFPGPTDGALLAAITWDELTMVWTTTSGSTVSVHYADRASRDAAFTTDHLLPASLGPFAEDKVGLSADGLLLMFTSADHKTLRQITRGSRTATFDEATVTGSPFTRISGAGGEGGPAKQLSDLVLSKDGNWLFYTDLLRTSGPSIMLSIKLGDGTWDFPNPITASSLSIDTGRRRRPTGISSDSRTLFYFDEVSEATYVAFRYPGTALFTEFYAYAPTGSRAMPADVCDRVYLDMEVADKPDGGTLTVTKSIFHAP
ncbi:MAG: hypothetical protein ACXVEF_11280 [Polyangiales bacterium]